MATYLAGLLLGLAMILPIGMQNLFVLNQGLLNGFPRVLFAIVGTSFSDTLLILLGAAGASALLATLPGLRAALIVVGVAFLTVLGILSLISRPERVEVMHVAGRRAILLQAVGVSLLNPHAVLDTVGVIGGAIAAQAAGERMFFALGAITASWVWFLGLGIGASVFEARLTRSVRLWIQRASGVLMLVFAARLALELG